MISRDYFFQKFLQLIPFANFQKLSNKINGCCIVCREGKSFGKKKRFYFDIASNRVSCFNCGLNLSAIKFLMQHCNMTYEDIVFESKDYDILPADITINEQTRQVLETTHILPADSINLYDANQVNFYKDNKVVQIVSAYVKQRRLDTAINKPTTLWVSLTDYLHKNRLVLPFYDESSKIIFYQTREVIPSQYPKYISKVNGERSLFNYNKISSDLDKIFIHEGPINSCFIKNSIAVGGINDNSNKNLTYTQESQLSKLFQYEHIWCIDSQWIDAASYKKTKILIECNYNVFIWPEKLGRQFKDINEMCVKLKLDSISPDWIIKNTYSGLRARIFYGKLPNLTES